MKNLFSLLFLLLAGSILGQTYTDAYEVDPKAKKILDALKNDYLSAQSVTIDFKLELEFPGEAVEIQNGSVAQKGDAFRLDMGAQELFCTGNEIWIYLKEMNEVQINNFEEEDQSEFMSPKEVFKLYESGQFTYAITNRFEENGETITQIEFKPLDRNSEYSKLRLSLYKNDSAIKKLKIFARDGSRYTMNILSLETNKSLSDDYFKFKKADYPGVTVEDLRL